MGLGNEENGSIVHKYRIIGKAGEGTFSEVLKAVHIHTKKYVAIKRMKQKFQSVQQVNNLREVQALRRLNPHSHIIGLREIIFDRRVGSLSLVCELSDMNLYELIRTRSRPMPELKVQHFIYQLFNAIDHTHRAGIYHRDIKPENILITKDTLKVADFGSCRSVYSKQPLTEYISTRWYRPPECLLTEGRYGYKMDLWAAGCVMYELATLKPLFPGSNELDQLHRIHAILGTPSERVLNKFYQFRNRQIPWDFPERSGSGIERGISAMMSKSGISLLYKLLKYDPDDRITARLALRSEWCQIYKLHKKGQRDVREASRDSGVDVNTPIMPEINPLPKEDKFTIDNKNTIPKYKFNQKKQNLRKQIQKPSLDNSKLPSIETKKALPKLSGPSAFGSKPTNQMKGFGPKSTKRSILPKLSNSPRVNKQRGKSNPLAAIGPQITKLKGSPPKAPLFDMKSNENGKMIPPKKTSKKNPQRVTRNAPA